MNRVERFFAGLTEQCVRDGSIASVKDLRDSIAAPWEDPSRAPKPYRWKASGAEILAKIQRATQAARSGRAVLPTPYSRRLSDAAADGSARLRPSR